MRYRLLDILACPACHGFPLQLEVIEETNQQPKEVLSGRLQCPKCHRQFKIEGGVPNFMGDALIEEVVLKQKTEYDTIKYEKSYWYPQIVIDRVRSRIDNSFAKNSFLLDLGTGAGVWANVFSNDFSVIGLDIDIFNLYNGRKKYPHIDFVCASVTSLPFREGGILVVFSGLLLHHLYSLGLDKIFAEIYRALASGGQFFAYEPNKYHPVTFLRFSIIQFLIRCFGQKLVWKNFGFFETLEERLLSPPEVQLVALGAGFNCQIETCFGVPSLVLNKLPFLNNVSRLLEKNIFLAGSFFLDGRKR